MILPAVLSRRGKYSVAEPLFVEETRPVLIARKLRHGAEAGDLVLVQSREKGRSLRGEVKKVLGSSRDPRNVYEALFASVDTSRGFSNKVEREAEEVAAKDFGGGREDLRDLPTVTIDGADAKDFDDAITVNHEGEGYRVWVHIADVTHYVEPGSRLDREALRRGNSVYLPGRVAPMLPEKLSNEVCSLNPEVDRAAVTVEMRVDGDGDLLEKRAYRSLIRSDARLTYEAVDAFLAGEDEIPQSGMVSAARELAKKLRTKAVLRGKLEISSGEPEYELDGDGVPADTHLRHETAARSLIEELMVLTNQAVALMLEEHGIFRVHDSPDAAEMELLEQRLRAIGFHEEPDSGSLSDIAARAKSNAVSQLILRALPRAMYSPNDSGHFGLALEHYTHFTSPIRRYSDILVHRALLDEDFPEDASEVAQHISAREYASALCERSADDYTLMWLMSDRAGENVEGTVVGTASFGLFVELENGATGMVHVSKLPGWWELESNGVVLSNEEIGSSYRIGDRVLVEVLDVKPLMGRVELGMVKRL